MVLEEDFSTESFFLFIPNQFWYWLRAAVLTSQFAENSDFLI